MCHLSMLGRSVQPHHFANNFRVNFSEIYNCAWYYTQYLRELAAYLDHWKITQFKEEMVTVMKKRSLCYSVRLLKMQCELLDFATILVLSFLDDK